MVIGLAAHESDDHWRYRAECSPEDLDFFTTGGLSAEEHALTICCRCPVKADCLAFALDERIPYGIFGETTPRQRRTVQADRPRPSAHSNPAHDSLG
ncbi:WhiB family transcriptional regulator [Streptomyces sp. x-80]|uniref:WhiB family transcriptional regulator n=1 Tax=Streptomyces sp. x-80 TaxID=2789282 RepID=UPI0039806B1D